MKHQVVGISTDEINASVNLVVVKPEIRLENLDASVLTVNTNGAERNVHTVYLVIQEVHTILMVNILPLVSRKSRAGEPESRKIVVSGVKTTVSRSL